MDKFNSYWTAYTNLEEEVIELSKYISFCDNQVEVYSMHIADLIMRIAVEVEDISKELYKSNGGPPVFNDKGEERFLNFDTDCISYLNKKWKICNRKIVVSCTDFNFVNENNKIITPLKNANKKGNRSARWNKAYQALKHDRRGNLEKGSIGNLIQALGALYILNIYYRDKEFGYGNILFSNGIFDNRLGSKIFAVIYVDATKATLGGDDTDKSISSEEIKKLLGALCIVKFTNESWKYIQGYMKELNKNFFYDLENDSYYIEKLKNLEKMDEKTRKDEEGNMQVEYLLKHVTSEFINLTTQWSREVILNKGQAIYKDSNGDKQKE